MDRNDPEIRAFIRRADPETYSALAEEIRHTFGESRAWSVALVADVYRELNAPRAGKPSRYEADMAVMAWLRDRADLVRRTPLDRLLKAGIGKFGKERFPSRSALHRLIQKIRIETRAEAERATNPPRTPDAD